MTSTTPTLSDLWSEANWLEWRSRVDTMPAIRLTELVTDERSRGEFIEGARLLRLDQRVRAGDGGCGPSPVQLLIADMLNAGHFMNAIDDPRRTTKTTAVQAVLLGRCFHREDYQVGWTMFTTGAKAGERFRKDIVAHLEKLYPSAKTSPIKINVGKGTEHLEFVGTSSFLNVYTPNGDGFRSGGFDAVFGDEAGEADLEQGEDVNRSVVPTMDTKIGAQFILAGTGATWRTGNLLWEALHDPDAGVVWHGIPERTDRAELVSWEPGKPHPKTGATGGRMREHIEAAHPGVSFTTPIEAVERSFNKFSLDDFLIEYGGQFGLEGSADTMIPPAWWERAARPGPPPEPPAKFTAALKVHHAGASGALAVCWDWAPPGDLVTDALALDGIDEREQHRAVAVWWYQQGTEGLAREVLSRARRRGVPIVYDNHGHTALVAQKLEKAVPKPKLIPTTARDVPLSVAALLQALEDRTVVHFRQAELDTPAGAAVSKAFGQYSAVRFGEPKSDPDLDLVCLEAAAMALHYHDKTPTPTVISPTDVMSFQEF